MVAGVEHKPNVEGNNDIYSHSNIEAITSK